MRFAVLGGMLVVLSAGSHAAQAQDPLSVTVELRGRAFEGPPSFELLADGENVGSGTLAMPVEQPQEFSFELSGGENVESLAIVYTNDLFREGEGDRNLYVVSVTVGSTSYPGSALVPGKGERVQGAELWLVRDGEAVLSRPSGGWVADEEADAEAVAEAVAAAVPCEAGDLAITGFANGKTEVPPGSTAAVEALVATGGGCLFEVIGYSSTVGTVAANEWMANARAEAVAALLVKLGVEESDMTVRSGGPTNQFGAVAQENRRVVVSVSQSAAAATN